MSKNTNYNLYLHSILANQNYIFVDGLAQSSKNCCVFLGPKFLFFLFLHFRLSSLFYSAQLVDIFSYEILNKFKSGSKPNPGYGGSEGINPSSLDSYPRNSTPLVAYNLHLLNTQHRFFFLCRMPYQALIREAKTRSQSLLFPIFFQLLID